MEKPRETIVSYKHLHPELRKIVDMVKGWRQTRLSGPAAGIGAALAFGKMGQRDLSEVIVPAVATAAATVFTFRGSNSMVKNTTTALGERVRKGLIIDPKVRVLQQEKYPLDDVLREKHKYVLIHRKGDLVFTNRERFLKIFGRQRVPTK